MQTKKNWYWVNKKKLLNNGGCSDHGFTRFCKDTENVSQDLSNKPLDCCGEQTNAY